MFVQQLNKETGELEWAAVGSNEHQTGEQGEPTPNHLACHWLLLPSNPSQLQTPTVKMMQYSPIMLGSESDGEAGDAAIFGLLQSSTYLDMLHDTTRNQAYALAIEEAVRSTIASGPILDIGTGTGLLALMASR